MLEIVEKIKTAEESSGVGYYRTFLLEDIVVKKYSSNILFEIDIQKHLDLDEYNLLPKMITNFAFDDYYYLVVERIYCFNDEYRKGLSQDYYDYDSINLPDDFWCLFDEYTEKLSEHNKYKVFDVMGANFGLRNKIFMCLDEGCIREL